MFCWLKAINNPQLEEIVTIFCMNLDSRGLKPLWILWKLNSVALMFRKLEIWKAAVGGLLVLRSWQIIIIQSASKKKIRAWNTKYSAANALDIFTLLTTANASFVPNVWSVLRKPFPHNPSVLPGRQLHSGRVFRVAGRTRGGPSVTSVCLHATAGRPPPSPGWLQLTTPHQVQVLITFITAEFTLRFSAAAHEYLINCL